MSFGITPREYLAIVNQEYDEFNHPANKTSIKHAMRCAVFSYHILENIWSFYKSDSAKVFGHSKFDDFQAELIAMCPDLGIIRDISDYSKHTILCRKSVEVSKTVSKMVPDMHEFIMAIAEVPTGGNPCVFDATEALLIYKEGALIVTLKNGLEHRFNDLLKSVVEFWRTIFDSQGY